MRFKQFLENDFDDMFPDVTPKEVIKTEQKIINITLSLYRGFDSNLSKLRHGSEYVFSPKKCEQGILWFAHDYANSHFQSALEYARSHGKWLLTYELPVKKHVAVNHYEDGSTHNAVPEYFHKLVDVTKNGRYYAGLELPDDWLFSYKVEKWIGCQKELRVSLDAVQPNP